MAARAEPRIAAFFDLDGTLLDSNIVVFYVKLMTCEMSKWKRRFWLLRLAVRIPIFLAVDKISRAAFNRLFYRLYRGVDVATIERLAAETFRRFTLPRLFPEATETIRRHQTEGHEVVFVTGTASFIAEPLAAHLGVKHVFAVHLEEKGARFTGRLLDEPLSGERKASVVVEFARVHGVDLSQSYAYGDSTADIPMLRAVGNPIVVNPSKRLRLFALRNGWRIVRWKL